VLLLIGVNDLLPLVERPVNPADAPANLARLVQRLQELRPQVYIFVASLTPTNYHPLSSLPAYQGVNQMAEQLGTADPQDRIYFVDLNRVLERTLDRQTDFADSVHLTEGGARKMAQVWFDALVASGLLIQLPP
jgi:lysophospholipase L1-like esterase